MRAPLLVELTSYPTTGALLRALPPEGVWFWVVRDGVEVALADGTPVSPTAWHTLLSSLDPGLGAQDVELCALACAVHEDHRDIGESMDAPLTAADVEAGRSESEVWVLEHAGGT